MRKLALLTAAAALALPFAAVPAHADNHEGAEPELAALDWYRVNLVKWKPGQREKAHEMIEKFEAVDKELGWDGTIHIHMNTGEWDSIVAFPMRGGIASMGWEDNPDGKKWMETFTRQMGGEEKAKKFFADFDGLIAREQRHIGHIDRD